MLFKPILAHHKKDGLSAILFAFYLAATLEYEVHMKHHQYALPARHLHIYFS